MPQSFSPTRDERFDSGRAKGTSLPVWVLLLIAVLALGLFVGLQIALMVWVMAS